MLVINPLAASLRLALASCCTYAMTAAAEPHIHEVRITALAVSGDSSRIASPFSVVSGDQLLRRGDATLSETLSGLPGVHADVFGAGVSRPVVRGQTAPRVQVLSNGSSVFDASGVSDHAITVEPLLAQQVEVLRGPAALLYGGDAIGGVVNVVDNKIPGQMPAGFTEVLSPCAAIPWPMRMQAQLASPPGKERM